MTDRVTTARAARSDRASTTQEAILTAAERLFAEHGVFAVSNRQVSEAAGQGNNAAVGYREGPRVTADGLPHVFAINTLSAYILTGLIERPKRLVYLSSGMHHHAAANLDDILWKKRRWDGSTAYAESKLHDAMLAMAIAIMQSTPPVIRLRFEKVFMPMMDHHSLPRLLAKFVLPASL